MKLFDVIIYEFATGKVESIVGEKMERSTGFYNAEKRQLTALDRINDNYGVEIVETGEYKVNDIYKPAKTKKTK